MKPIDRRQFLKVAFSGTIAAAVPVAFAEVAKAALPIIWADGIHDDAPGLQAAIDGKGFYCEHSVISTDGPGVTIHDGVFWLDSPLQIIERSHVVIDHCHLKYSGRFAIEFIRCDKCRITNNFIEKIGPQRPLSEAGDTGYSNWSLRL